MPVQSPLMQYKIDAVSLSPKVDVVRRGRLYVVRQLSHEPWLHVESFKASDDAYRSAYELTQYRVIIRHL